MLRYNRPNADMDEREFRRAVASGWPKGESKQFALKTGTFTNDTPDTNSVTWASCVVEYLGETYDITDGNTSDKYIYWESATPTVFSHSATIPTITENLIIVGVNTSGAFKSAWKAGQAAVVANTVSADAIDGMTITGATIQTESTADRGLKLTSNAIIAYNSTGDVRFQIVTSGLLMGNIYAHSISGITGGKAITFGSGAISLNCDLSFSIAGTGLILQNAAGTVTKRVRLNDAGDGLIFETP